MNSARYEIFLRCLHFCEVWNLLAMHKFLRGKKFSHDAWILTRDAWSYAMHEYWLAMHDFLQCMDINSRFMIFCDTWILTRDALFSAMHVYWIAMSSLVLNEDMLQRMTCLIPLSPVTSFATAKDIWFDECNPKIFLDTISVSVH